MNGQGKVRIGKEALIMAALLLIMLFLLTAALGLNPFLPSPFNSYTLQALAWRRGEAALAQNVPHLELAIYQGKYFVSFPPVPGVPVYLLTILYSAGVPDGLLVKLYGLIAFFALYRLLRRRSLQPWPAAVTAFLLCTASSMLPLMLTGAVWYQAQVMAFMFSCLALNSVHAGQPTRALFFYALSVGCRPFNALYGLLLIVIYFQLPMHNTIVLKQKMKRLVPGILIGVCVAALYGWYNVIRFDDPFEFGHSFLPEFSSQGGRQFALWHISRNVPVFIFGLPFKELPGSLTMTYSGFSLFIANPILLLLLIWGLRDIVQKKMNALMALTLCLCLLHLLLLLSHRTFGGFQYGARYAVDIIPYAAIYMVQSDREVGFTKGFIFIMTLGLVLAIWGSLVIVLPR